MNLVTVATFSSIIDLRIIKGRLETDGITCYIKDEHTVSIDPLLDIPVGGIKLQVADTDVEQAKLLLKETSYEDSGSLIGFNLFRKIRKERSPFKIVLLILFALLMLLFFI